MRLLWKKLGGKQGLSHVAVTRLGAQSRTQPHTHDFHEMFLVLDGSGTHHRGKESISLGAGHLVFVEPDDSHSFSTGPRECLDFVNVAVPRTWLSNLEKVAELPEGWRQAGDPRGHLLVENDTCRELRLLMFRLIDARREPEALAVAWIRAAHARERSSPTSEAPPTWLSSLHRELHNPAFLAEPIGFWQKRSGRTAEHLARSCRRYYGAPLNELINGARIARVQYLLQTTEEKVTTLAFAVGYNNLAHFYRVFERLTGETPHSWRRRTAACLVPGSDS